MKSLSVVRILWVLTIGYTSALTIGSLIKPVHIDTTITNIDKLLHAGAYLGLTVLWMSLMHLLMTARSRKEWASLRSYIAIAVVLVIYGIIIELLQGGLTDYRTPDHWDVMANTLGVLMGSLTFMLFFKKFKGLKSQF